MAIEKIRLSEIEKIDFVNIKGGLTAKEVMAKYKPDYLLNGTMYDMATGRNYVDVEDENVRDGYLGSDEGIGIKGDKELVWVTGDVARKDNAIRDFMGAIPTLVIDGKVNNKWGDKYDTYIDKSHKRSVFGFNNEYIFLVSSDYDNTIKGLADYCIKNGMKYAINMDGGASCHLQKGSSVVKLSGRKNASWILVYLKKNINRPIYNVGGENKPEYIVIHDTGNTSVGADAKAHINYFNSANRNASAHYFVDDKGVMQFASDYIQTWHCGKKYVDKPVVLDCDNSNSIGIEMCVNSDGDFEKTKANTKKLVEMLMIVHNIPIHNVITHRIATGKNCPSSMTDYEVSQMIRKTMYRVCVGSYSNKENADKMINELKEKGYDPFIAIYKE